MNIIDKRNLLIQGNAAIVIQKKDDKFRSSWRLYPSTHSLITELKSLQSQQSKKCSWSRCYMTRFAFGNALTIFINRFVYYPAFTMEVWRIDETNDCTLSYEHTHDENN